MYAEYLLLGTFTTTFLPIPLNAPFLTPSTSSLVDLIVIVFKFLQFLKAFFPISSTFLLSVMLFNFLHFSNALFPIEVTLLPTVTLVIFLLFLNVLAAMAVIL